MEIENDVPVPDQIRGRSRKYDFASMKINDSFFVPGDSSVQVSILTCAKRYDKKKRFVTKKAKRTTDKGRKTEMTEDGYRCWRVK